MFRSLESDEERLVVLLQAVSLQCHARWTMNEQTKRDPSWTLTDARIDELVPGTIPVDTTTALQEVFGSLSRKPDEAAAMTFAIGQLNPVPETFFATARSLIFAKSGEAHDLKCPAAVFEDQALINECWRPHLLAASTYWLKGTDLSDAPSTTLARQALESL